MSDSNKPETAKLLRHLGAGATAATEEAYQAIYPELRCIAARWFRGAGRGQTLQPTALVHEAYVHLIDQSNQDYRNRAHFHAVAALAMRQILVQHARKRKALKRGGGWQRITLSQASPSGDDDHPVDLLDLDEALTQLHTLHERQARVVELRFFGELSVEETAEVLDVSPRTVKLDWRMARAWLRSTLQEGMGS